MSDCELIVLDETSWLDHHRGWLRDTGELLQELAKTRWEQETIVLFGRPVRQPRLTAWFGIGMDAATRYRTTRPASPWPERLERVRREVSDHAGVEFNSALANLYRDGKDSVAWHADDEAALGHEPVIASVSLGAPRRFLLRKRDKSRTVEVALGDGDLLVMHGATQRDWLHSIPKTSQATSSRVNLTFRAYQR
jgi:alkylated DNA repair dioxygenase AlkB